LKINFYSMISRNFIAGYSFMGSCLSPSWQ
jgi:hypothetical protein